LVLNILILALGIGYGFRVNDVLDTLGGIVEDTQRQSDVNDKVPAVFAATLGASLIANAVLNPKDGLNRIDCRCGVERGSRIVGGADVDVVNKYPWMVALVSSWESLGFPQYDGLEDIDSHLLQFCGGSLVSSKHVVTAAHCLFKSGQNIQPEWNGDLGSIPLKESEVLVRVGDHDLFQLAETEIEESTIKVAKITLHPNYEGPVQNPWTGLPMPPLIDNDIAILELEEELDLREYTPICLAGTGVKESGTGTVAGWGLTRADPFTCGIPSTGQNPFPDILQETTMRMCSDAEAAALPVFDNQICAVGAGTSSYTGDSGGPFSLKSGDQHVQVGGVSFSLGCVLDSFTGDVSAVFSRISFFRQWLEAEMKGATVCRNGFDADTALPRNLNPRNWSSLAKRPAVHTRVNLGNKKRNKNRNRNKNKKGKTNKKE